MKTLEAYNKEKEKEVKDFWDKHDIANKVRHMNDSAEKTFYFMDGPPYATGHIHMGTALNKILKDVAIRYWRMNGRDVFDRPGYDCHGMPIEFQVEKELGFRGKHDIENYGVGKFVEKCREYATKFIGTMNDEFADLGVWMDWENPYLTLNNEYIESIWWTFKKAEEKGLLYKGTYPVHVCPRCATAVAYNEIEYTKQTDNSIYFKFPVMGKEKTFLLIWTTTPWTLPGNTGVMVHPTETYVEVEVMGETWIMAKELLQKLMEAIEAGYVVKREFPGKELEGWRYENPLEKHMKRPEFENANRVVLSARFVNVEDGTGLVHTAPGHGKEDFTVGRETGLPAYCPVKINGELTEETGKYAGKKAREVDKEIVSDLEESGNLIYKHPYTHDYPICWRCKSPLLMVSIPQWFLKVESIQKKAVDLNQEVNWVPSWMEDRMHDWLDTLNDWPVTRERYWGAPCPIWICECGEQVVIGSLKELKEKTKVPKDLELHKPFIDEITIPCKCGGTMTRVKETLDVWFDAGISSWGALDYSKGDKLFKKYWPADLNIEATEQVRGWWNAELLNSVISFDEKPFKNIMVHGMVTDLDKKKMSKSLGNNVQPSEVFEKHNRDYLRFHLTMASRGEDFGFDWEIYKDISRFFNIFWNSMNFAALYMNLDLDAKVNMKKLQAEDKWILSRLNSLVEECDNAFETYVYFKVPKLVSDFVLEDFSRTYIKLVRGRIGTETGEEASKVMSVVVKTLMKILAPVTPHISEYIYQYLKKAKSPESVHMLPFPKAFDALKDESLEKEMNLVREISQSALSLREEHKMRLRWPLKELVVLSKEDIFPNLKHVLASMVNVKKIRVHESVSGNYAEGEASGIKFVLNIDADSELKQEWEFRELVRRIQSMRKEEKLNPNDTIDLFLGSDDSMFLKKWKTLIEKETNTKISEKQGELQKVLERSFYIEIKK
ncbi:MAG: isoleucine--tRNA ligase [Candidatus Diapherotrites archaeon]